MTTEEIVKKLEPWLARHRRSAWKPVVEDGDGPATVSKFCGVPWIGPDAPWPECGHCKKPLQLFLQLDLGDLLEELGGRFGTGLLQLFYCTRDSCQGYGGWEPFSDDISLVRVVQPTGLGLMASVPQQESFFPAKRIVGWTRFLDLPKPSEHEELGLKYTYDFDAGTLRLECPELEFDLTNPMHACPAEEIANSELGDKLAGWPAWVQNVEYPNCPRCGRRMVHFFQVGSEDNIPFMFGDAGCGHITQCPQHKEVVAFGWACC
jgi:uncharacterized protein YwqG